MNEKSKKVIRPLNRSILIAIVIFLSVLSIGVCVMQYYTYRGLLYNKYEEYIGSILKYTASVIDVDDLKECIETGEESDKYRELQRFLDHLRDNVDMHFLYVVIPLNTEEKDNMVNVIAAVSKYEYEYLADELVYLNMPTGDSYSPATAKKYLDAYNMGRLSFFEDITEWGDDYTGLLPLYDSSGHRVAALCMDVEIHHIHVSITVQMIKTILVIVLMGVIFAISFFVWADINITYPLETLERSVVSFAEISHRQRDPDALVMQPTDIHTRNEVESLAHAVEKMSEDMRDYVKSILSTEQELEKMNVIAHKDSLTGVNNKTSFDMHTEELNAKIERGESVEFAILMIDLNYLKLMNDNHGHECGDMYLKNCCNVICHVFTHSPVFRVGGDEFTVLLTGEDYENRNVLLAKVQLEYSKTSSCIKPWERLSVAMGLADYRPDSDRHVGNVLRRADRKMYLQKKKMKAFRTA